MSKVVMTDIEFVAACNKAKNYDELMAATGLKKTTLTQRRSQLRALKWPIPEFTKGRSEGSSKVKAAPSLEDLQALAAITGKTIETIQAESEAVAAQVAKHSASVTAGKEAAKLTTIEGGAVETTETTETTEAATQTEATSNVG